MNRKSMILIPLTILFCCAGQAADRALLVGIGQFQDKKIMPLPGIDKDLTMMSEVCRKLGIPDVKILRDEQATRANITKHIEQWLIEGVQPGDRALLYYSGHGLPMRDTGGDEADHLDECLVPYDAAISANSHRNLLADDDLNALIRRIPTRHTWVIVDACNSGTVTKKIDSEQWVSKSAVSATYSTQISTISRKPRKNTRGRTRGFGVRANRDSRFISFSAAEDHEQAIATSEGSLFTLALYASIQESSTDRRATFRELHENISNVVQRVTNGKHRQNPVLGGDSGAFDLNIYNVDGRGRNWEWFHWLAAKANYDLKLSANKTDFRLDESLVLKLERPRSGYLNIVSIDSKDNMTLLYPNKWDPENQVNPSSEIQIPSKTAGFHLPAVEPLGEAMVIAIHTSVPLHFASAAEVEKEAFKSLENKPAREKVKRVRGFKVQGNSTSSDPDSNDGSYGARILYFNITR